MEDYLFFWYVEDNLSSFANEVNPYFLVYEKHSNSFWKLKDNWKFLMWLTDLKKQDNL